MGTHPYFRTPFMLPTDIKVSSFQHIRDASRECQEY